MANPKRPPSREVRRLREELRRLMERWDAVIRRGAELERDLAQGLAQLRESRAAETLREIPVTQAEHPPEEAWLVVEKGAAKRLLGQPAESTLSLLTKPLFQCDICYSFRREDFHPAPSVDAVLLHLRRKQVPDVPSEQMPQYRRFVTGCFQKQGYGLARRLTKRQISTALRLAHLPAALSEREMKYVQWLCLFRWAERFGKTGG